MSSETPSLEKNRPRFSRRVIGTAKAVAGLLVTPFAASTLAIGFEDRLYSLPETAERSFANGEVTVGLIALLLAVPLARDGIGEALTGQRVITKFER